MNSSKVDLGYPIHDCTSSTHLYSDNNACVKWCHSMMTKGNRHIENRENFTWEWVADGTISVSHVSGKCNIADIFTKDMRDSANIRHLRGAFVCRASNYLNGILPNVPNAAQSPTPASVLAQSLVTVPISQPDMLEVLATYSGLQISSALSCISNAGRYILSKLAPPSYVQALMSKGCFYAGYSYQLPRILDRYYKFTRSFGSH